MGKHRNHSVQQLKPQAAPAAVLPVPPEPQVATAAEAVVAPTLPPPEAAPAAADVAHPTAAAAPSIKLFITAVGEQGLHRCGRFFPYRREVEVDLDALSDEDVDALRRDAGAKLISVRAERR
jgi:hypothetical protein